MNLTAEQHEALDKLFGDKRITDDAQYMLLAETLGLGEQFRDLQGTPYYIKRCLRLQDLAASFLQFGKTIGKAEWLRFCAIYGHEQTPNIRPSTTELVQRLEDHVAKHTKDVEEPPADLVRFINGHGLQMDPEDVPEDSLMYLNLAATLYLSEILHRQQAGKSV